MESDVLRIIGSRLDALITLERTLGSQRLAAPAEAELALLTGLLEEGAHDPATRAELYAAASFTAGLRGWIAYDADDFAGAESFFHTSRHLADVGGATELHAHFTMHLAYQQCAAHAPAAALTLLNAELNAPGERPCARTTAALHAASARAHALLGDHVAHGRSVAAARTALRHDEGSRTSPLTSWITASALESQWGSDLLDLGRPRQALVHLAVSGSADQDDRTAAIRYVRAARVLLAGNEVEAAVAWALWAADRLHGIRSGLVRREADRLLRALGAYRDVPAVRDFLRCAGPAWPCVTTGRRAE
ncbi:hypothetical protein [Streptomyces halobius]|uniref:Transcriptional regulator n=1 Tax=Streptomyces halobius TaxID=2879846 RepID=A0ABY4MHY1_9ACTN|nr:hypothetical protein [Streptomyces halobius]UQA97414.1 hypothetical protein K9S39_41115 [Streptomyces halobius]